MSGKLRRWVWAVMVAGCWQGAWAADCPKSGTSTVSGTLTGSLSFGSNSTSWTFSSGAATNLVAQDCNKRSVFLASPQNSVSTTGGGTASVNGQNFPYQLQQSASWVTWGNLYAALNNTNGIVVAADSNSTTSVPVRIVQGSSPPAFPRAGTYSGSVDINRNTLDNSDVLETPSVESTTANVSITVPFQCELTWANNDSTLVLNYTSFDSAQSDAIQLNIRCNDTYQIGLSVADSPSTALLLTDSALGLSYTLTLSGAATNNAPELVPPASTRTITASALPNQGGAVPGNNPAPGVTCAQTSQGPGGCAQWSQTQTYYVVISQ